MQDRLNHNDVTNRVNVEDPDRVRDTVLALLAARYPGSDFAALARGFDDCRALFEGSFPGYLACDSCFAATKPRCSGCSPTRARAGT